MSKSRPNKKNLVVVDEWEEERRPKQKQDKRKERRIARALKTKNVQEFLRYDESIDLDPIED
jgi:hypothetical protein